MEGTKRNFRVGQGENKTGQGREGGLVKSSAGEVSKPNVGRIGNRKREKRGQGPDRTYEQNVRKNRRQCHPYKRKRLKLSQLKRGPAGETALLD